MESDLRQLLLEAARAFASADQCALSTVSRRCRNDSGFFRRIEDPAKSFTARTFDEVMQWFSSNWPEGTERPSFVQGAVASAPNSSSPDNTAGHADAALPDPIPEISELPETAPALVRGYKRNAGISR